MSPLLTVTVHPKSEADEAALRIAMRSLTARDAALSLVTDADTAETIVSGASESHLDVVIESLRGLHKIDFATGQVQVAYREIIGGRAETAYTHKRADIRQYAQVRMTFEPLEPGGGIVFENRVSAGVVPYEYIRAIENGLRLQANSGVLAGFPTVDFRCIVTEAQYHDVDSSARVFEAAAKACFRELRNTGLVRIVEPIMDIDVMSDPEKSHEIIDDLEKRDGKIQGIRLRNGKTIVTALVPLKRMLGYANALRRLSQGHAQFMMLYSHYQEVVCPEPPDDLLPIAVALRA